MTTPTIDRGQWYVTAHTVQSKVVKGQLVELPVSLAHAKRMGTLLTACGTWAYPWRKIYDLPFPLPHDWRHVLESCPECFEVVMAEAES